MPKPLPRLPLLSAALDWVDDVAGAVDVGAFAAAAAPVLPKDAPLAVADESEAAVAAPLDLAGSDLEESAFAGSALVDAALTGSDLTESVLAAPDPVFGPVGEAAAALAGFSLPDVLAFSGVLPLPLGPTAPVVGSAAASGFSVGVTSVASRSIVTGLDGFEWRGVGPLVMASPEGSDCGGEARRSCNALMVTLVPANQPN